MKKLLCCALLAALLLAAAVPALAVPSLDARMFTCAKNALICLASGDYDRVVTGLPFSGLSPSADEWRSFAQGSFSGLTGSNPQTTYAVAYWTGSVWRIAVPVSAPSSGGVETLVLSSEDGVSFTGYACLSWGSVQGEYQSADYVTWSDEYTDASYAVVENDVN